MPPLTQSAHAVKRPFSTYNNKNKSNRVRPGVQFTIHLQITDVFYIHRSVPDRSTVRLPVVF
jgi:hypothetical protein